MKSSKTRVDVRPSDIQITSKGVELTGEAAKRLARVLAENSDAVLGAARRLDAKLKPHDIQVDCDGRVIVRSARIQKLTFESVRYGVNPASSKSLGRLVRRTGGRLGPLVNAPGLHKERNQTKPPVQIQSVLHEANFMCRGKDGLNVFCGEWDEAIPGDADINCFCDWGSG